MKCISFLAIVLHFNTFEVFLRPTDKDAIKRANKATEQKQNETKKDINPIYFASNIIIEIRVINRGAILNLEQKMTVI